MLHVILYKTSTEVIQDLPLSKLEYSLSNSSNYAWIDLISPSDADLQSVFERIFPIHRLALEDVLQEEGTAKIGNFGDYLTVVFHFLEPSSNALDITVVEYAAIVGRQILVTVCQESDQSFERELSELSRGPHIETAENLGAAGLLYRLMDRKAAISRMQVENLENRLEAQGDLIFSRDLSSVSRHQLMDEILSVKATALRIHRSLAPQVKVLEDLGNFHFAVIPTSSRIYFLDVQDQIQYLVSKSASVRDLATSTIATHLTLANHRLNEVMKVLTMIATIFIPLTFVTSIYGMNFRYMPELGWSWSYPAVLIFCILVALVMLLFFKFRKWF